jgi:hypothetical protein
MPIIHYPGFITKQKAANHYKVKLNTIRSWMRHHNSFDKEFAFIIIDGFVCIKDHLDKSIVLPTSSWLN